MPKVSVIIPNFNHSKYLSKRIDTVLNQTYQDFEIILMDDKSTDSSLDIINIYKNNTKVSKIILNNENSGNTFKQWNKGIREASGIYVWIAESDDFTAPNFLEKLVENLEKDESIGLACSHSIIVDENDRIIEYTKEIEYEEEDTVYKGMDFLSNNMLLWNFIPNASAIVFRKSCYEKISGANESMKLCADWLVWVRILLNNKIFVSFSYLNYYRRHSNNVRSKINYASFIYEHLIVLLFIKKSKTIEEKKIDSIVEIRFKEWIALIKKENAKIRFIINSKSLLKLFFIISPTGMPMVLLNMLYKIKAPILKNRIQEGISHDKQY